MLFQTGRLSPEIPPCGVRFSFQETVNTGGLSGGLLFVTGYVPYAPDLIIECLLKSPWVDFSGIFGVFFFYFLFFPWLLPSWDVPLPPGPALPCWSLLGASSSPAPRPEAEPGLSSGSCPLINRTPPRSSSSCCFF